MASLFHLSFSLFRFTSFLPSISPPPPPHFRTVLSHSPFNLVFGVYHHKTYGEEERKRSLPPSPTLPRPLCLSSPSPCRAYLRQGRPHSHRNPHHLVYSLKGASGGGPTVSPGPPLYPSLSPLQDPWNVLSSCRNVRWLTGGATPLSPLTPPSLYLYPPFPFSSHSTRSVGSFFRNQPGNIFLKTSCV